MLIRVVYPNGRYDMVNGAGLDLLIEKKAIRSFRRSSGWVLLGVDPVRNPKSKVEYTGEKRRAMDLAHSNIGKSASPVNMPSSLSNK